MHCPSFVDHYSFVINGYIVSDFDYLLRLVTPEKLESFKDFEVIANNFPIIERAIENEMAKDIPSEAKVNFTNPEGARRNLEKLRYIVQAINEYVSLARKLELPVNPLLSGS